jgi:hypothetical protein
MIEHKDIPSEFVSIRQVWLKQIDRCTEAISHRFMQDTQNPRDDRSGDETVIESILALQFTLVDFGEATLKSDLNKWIEEVYRTAKDKDQRVKWAEKKFEFIIERMNRYGMLFESCPQGYSNVEMKSVS